MGWEHAVPEWQVWITFFAVLGLFSGGIGVATYMWMHRRTTWRR